MSEVRTASGRRIFYDEVGEGPPLLLIPGMLGNRRGLEGRLAMALTARHRVVAMDLRDAGESSPEPDYYTMADLAGDAAALLDALGIARVRAVGYSLGGMITLQLALDHPHRVNRLVLISTFAHGEQGHRADEPLPPPAEWWSDDPVQRTRANLPYVVGPDYRERLTDSELAVLAEEDRDNCATWAGTMRQEATQAGHDLRSRLGEVQVPTLVIHGEADPLVRLEHGEVLAAGIPDARLVVLPGVGHLPWVEQPEDVTRAILDFVAEEAHSAG